MTVQPGTVVGGDFRVAEPLAEGADGRLFVAEQISSGARRALKLLPVGLITDRALLARFEGAAKVGSTIASDHVVEVVAAGVDEALGVPWLAMEQLQGESLAAALVRRGAIPPHEARVLFGQLAHALAAAHRAAVVHCDLEPRNVFISRLQPVGGELKIKVLDFGVAQLLEEGRASKALSEGAVLPRNLAPEQTGGQPVTALADVWALGLLAFETLTGKAYWRKATGPSPLPDDLIREVLFEPLVPASRRAVEHGVEAALPPGFDPWFARCVAREPSERWPSAPAAFEALDRVLATAPAPTSAFAAYAIPGSRAESGGAGTTRVLSAAEAPFARDPAEGEKGDDAIPAVAMPPNEKRRALIIGGLAAGALALGGLGVGGFYAFKALSPPKKKKKPDADDEEEEDRPLSLPEDVTGKLDITEGTYPNAPGSYKGHLLIEPHPRVQQVYRVGWSNGTEGMGLTTRAVLGVAWGVEPYGVAVYELDRGTLKGRVVTTAASGIEHQELVGPPGFEGTYKPVNNPVGGSITLTPNGETIRVAYELSGQALEGTALKSGSTLVVSLGMPGAGGGVAVYTRRTKGYDGRWATLGSNAVGREKLKKGR